MSPPNIHFGSLKDGASAIEVFEAELISEMQSSRFILAAWQLQEKCAPPLSSFSSSLDLSKMEKKNGEMFHVSCLFLPKVGKKEGKRMPAWIYWHTQRGCGSESMSFCKGWS